MKKRNFNYILFIILIPILFTLNCKKLEIVELTKIKTGDVSDIGLSSANVSSIFVDASANVTEFGHCWNTSANPTIDNFKDATNSSAGKGIFTNQLTDLESNTTYYVRPFAVDNGEIIYGVQVSFITLVIPLSLNPSINGSIWDMASKLSIVWTEDITGNVTLKLRKNGEFVQDISTGIPADDGQYNWFVPAQLLAGLDYSIEIVSEDNGNIFHESDFFTINAQKTGTVNDIDGNTYPTIKIGEQWWMAKNLITLNYADGTPLIDGIVAGDITGDYLTRYYFAYDNNEDNIPVYGRLYTWSAVMNYSITEGVQGICPNGWHVPTDLEWKLLAMELGMSPSDTSGTGFIGYEEGGKLKDTGTEYWQSPNAGATNESSFSALPGGWRYSDGTYGYLGKGSDLWSSTAFNISSAWDYYLHFENPQIYRYNTDRTTGIAVRCIQGQGATTEFPDELYIYGAATDAGWTAANSIYMNPVGTKQFEVYVHLTTDAGGIKFIGNQDENNLWGMDPNNPGTITFSSNQVEIPAPAEEGFYYVQVDYNSMSYTITKVDFGIIGDNIPPYDWSADIDMHYIQPYTWIIEINTFAGEFKFRANDDWAINFGDGGNGTLLAQSPTNLSSDSGYYSISMVLDPVNGYTYSIIDATGTVSDFDGNTYNTIKIGLQWWMAENIKSIQYADGTALLDGSGAGDLSDDATSKYYFAPENLETNVPVYGRLYTQPAVMNGEPSTDNNPSGVQGICPTGWHVPSDSEWKELESYIGMPQNELDLHEERGTIEGGKLKEVSTAHWLTPNTDATDEYQFTILPANARQSDGSYGAVGYNAFFWTCSFYRILHNDSGKIGRYGHNPATGMSVRCVKD